MTGHLNFNVFPQLAEWVMAGFDRERRNDPVRNDISHAQAFWLLHKCRLCKDQLKPL